MNPDPAGAVAVAVAGGAAMEVRAAARASMFLGLAIAAIALVAATINPGRDFHALVPIAEHAAPAPAPVTGAQRCAASEAEALDLREAALELVLTGVVQAAFAAAAEVALAGSPGMLGLGHFLAAPAHIGGAFNAWYLCYVVHGAAVVAVGHCAGGYLAYLVIGYVLVAISYAVLLGVSLAVTFCF